MHHPNLGLPLGSTKTKQPVRGETRRRLAALCPFTESTLPCGSLLGLRPRSTSDLQGLATEHASRVKIMPWSARWPSGMPLAQSLARTPPDPHDRGFEARPTEQSETQLGVARSRRLGISTLLLSATRVPGHLGTLH